MPLISCPDCHHQVSDQAPTCPSCGRPINKVSLLKRTEKTIPVQRQVELPKKGFICESCGEVGWPKTVTRGSFFIELLLWLMLLVPGLIYTIWRLSSRYEVCPECSGRMVPIRSPGGLQLARKFNPHLVIHS